MRAPALVGIITALHILAISAFVLIQGCGTSRPTLTSRVPVEEPPPPVMPPRHTTGRTVLKAPTSIASKTAMRPASLEGTTSYKIKKGETLSHVAKKFGVSWREIAELNGIADPAKIKLGQEVRIPAHGKVSSRSATGPAPAPKSRAVAPAPSISATAAGGSYVVQAGDNLSKIARRHGVKVADLKSANGLSSDRILIGDKLIIPGGSAPSTTVAAVPAVASRPRTTSVTEEVDVLSLTSDTEISIEDIEIPQTPVMGTPAPSIPETDVVPQNKPIPYKIMDGDTLDEIAKLFIVSKREIMELNGLSENEALKPGTTIKIPPSAL